MDPNAKGLIFPHKQVGATSYMSDSLNMYELIPRPSFSVPPQPHRMTDAHVRMEPEMLVGKKAHPLC